jgi:hypothetical protein
MAKAKMCNSRLFLPSNLKIFIVSDELRRWGGGGRRELLTRKRNGRGTKLPIISGTTRRGQAGAPLNYVCDVMGYLKKVWKYENMRILI